MLVRFVEMTPRAERLMAYCARVSSSDQERDEYANLLRYCIKNSHWSVFEQAFMTIEIETARAITPQILRHRSFTFQEFSQRYSEPSGVEYNLPRLQGKSNRQVGNGEVPGCVAIEWRRVQEQIYTVCFDEYRRMLDLGIAKECARYILPMATRSRLYMCGSVRSWIHYIQLREQPHTQKEHRDIVLAVKEIFKEKLPATAEALEWKEKSCDTN